MNPLSIDKIYSMKAITLRNNKLAVSETTKPTIQDNEVLIKLNLAGVCSTDLEIVKGYVPNFNGILGHEFVGTVAETGENVPSSWQGKRVTATINIGCETCSVCVGEGSEHCPNRTVLGIINRDGIFAEYVAVPEANLVEIPADVPDKLAVFTEPLAAALRIREQLCVPPSRSVAVVGPGRLGMLVGWVLALSGNEVVMLGRREESLELAKKWGLKTDLTEHIEDNVFDFTVETTGNEAGLEHALRITRPRGTIVLKSTYAGPANVNLTKLVVAELNVIGSRCGPFEPAVRLLKTPKANEILDMVEGSYRLADGLAAFEKAAEPGVRKILLTP